MEENCQSLRFGDGLSCAPPSGAPTTADDSTEHHFTGKERDSESGTGINLSGNDYFAARYYQSAMGRWMSPDWAAKEEPVPYAKMDDPQSLNLYDYVRNNPLTAVDADGHQGERGKGQFFSCADEMENNQCQNPSSDLVSIAQGAGTTHQPPAQQQTLPANPSGLGSGWTDVTPTPGGKDNPKIPRRYRGPKGTEVEFDPGVEGKPG